MNIGDYSRYLRLASTLSLGVTQIIGFSASALVVLSMTSTSMYRLRVIGLLGAITFIAYGVLAEAWPIVATNISTLTLHVAYLRRFRALTAQDRERGSSLERWRSVAFEV